MKLLNFYFFLLFFSISSLFADTTHLNRKDVRKVMEELFEYHIDQKEMSSLLFERSLKVYVTNFDSMRAYLFANEVDSYLKPTKSLLVAMQRDYENDNYQTYFSLNQVIVGSVIRARGIRQKWSQHAVKLVRDAKDLNAEKMDENHPYPKTIDELEQNHYTLFLKLLKVNLAHFSEKQIMGKEAKVVALCEKQLTLIENGYLGQDETGHPQSAREQEHQVLLRTIKALANSLDANTSYYSPDEANAMKAQLEKKQEMCGIGVVLHEGLDGVMIADVIRGGPAEKSKLIEVKDQIVDVDGQPIKGYSFQKVLEILKGAEGSRAVLGIVRETATGEQKYLQVKLTRAKMAIDDKRVDVSFEPFGSGIVGKITLYSFYESDNDITSEKDIRQAIEYLQSQGDLQGLVLDMRDNGGGFLTQAVKVSGLFITGGVVVISKYSDGSVKYYRALDGQRFYDGPLVVLVSKGSASATEIVAQTLQDYGVAIVVGDEQTYGKGTIQHQTVTSSGADSFFKVTIGRYYTVSGRSTQIEGVKADIVIPTAVHFEKLGERYYDYPLTSDRIAPAYVDTLSDLDPHVRKWFARYYLPNIQPKVQDWNKMLAKLRENSQQRLESNKNFSIFLKKVKNGSLGEKEHYGMNDLQLDEACNILKDMILLRGAQVQ